MRIPCLVAIAAALSFSQLEADGFVLVSSGRRSLAPLHVDSNTAGNPPRTKPMSPEEIKARMRERQGLPPEEEEAPKLFSDSIYDDLQQALVTLEKRVQQGPGSLSMLEVEELCGQTQRIVDEMKAFTPGNDKVIDVSSTTNTPAAPAAVAEVPAPTKKPFPAPVAPVAPIASVTDAPLSPTSPDLEEEEEPEIVDLSEDEGPAWNGKGGMGMAKGTRNTYVIPGMEGMSPEEYQAALQQSLIDRQRERQAGGNYGNRATWDYLNNLTGEKGVLKEDDEEAP